MKKFVFSLQALYEYKQTVEKLQKGELSRAQAVLRELYAKDQELDDAFMRTRESLEEALQLRWGVGEALSEHDRFFMRLREEKEVLREKIKRAEDVRDKCQQRLITTMKELKAYAKLREEQYGEYLKEVQIEEEKNMGDLVSFSAIGGEVTTAPERKAASVGD